MPVFYYIRMCYRIFFFAIAFFPYTTSWSNSLVAQQLISDASPSPSCYVFTPNEGVYRYSLLHASQVDANTLTSLPPMTQSWRVTCDAPTQLEFSVIDNKSETLVEGADKTFFGLGFVNGIGKLGAYQMTLNDIRVDDKPALLYSSLGNQIVQNAVSSLTLVPTQRYGWTGDSITPATGQYYTFDVTVQPKLNSLKTTNGPLVNGAELDGSATFTFSFSI